MIAKGKSEPVPVWEAVQARSRFGVDVRQHGGAPLVGRERRARRAHLDARTREARARAPARDTRRRSRDRQKPPRLGTLRCDRARRDTDLLAAGPLLPYGQGVSFWALGEMVKAHAGIRGGRRRRGAREARACRGRGRRGRARVGRRAPRPARRGRSRRNHKSGRVVHRLASLLGVTRRAASARARLRGRPLGRRGAARLRRASRGVVARRPDPPRARPGPGCSNAAPAGGGGKLNSLTLALSPLSDDDSARLLALVLQRAVLPAETQAALLERASGTRSTPSNSGGSISSAGRWMTCRCPRACTA